MNKTVKPWDTIFQQEGRFFNEPHQALPGFVEQLNQAGTQRVLDLGCGSGRHVVYLAQQGFEVYGLDNSPNGLELTQRWLSEAGLSAELHLQDMTEPLPYEDQFFDGLISTQVIHHGRLTTVKAIVAEIERVLKPGGLVFISVPAEKNQAETFEEIEPHTFIPLDGPEKGLPHYYFTPETLREAFENFDVFDIQLDNVTHYCLWGQKKIATEL